MKRYYAAWFLLMAMIPGATAELRFKRQELREAFVQVDRIKRLNAAHRYLLLEFDHVPGAADRRALAVQGVLPVSAVPDRGLVVLAPDGVRIETDGLRGMGPFPPQLKWSRLLESRQASARAVFLVEFHPGVSAAEARAIALREGLLVREHPDLQAWHLLVAGTAAAARRLTKWDEVAYVFPASRDLEAGRPVRACAGAVTAAGPVAQYIATVGPGWDGYGLGAAVLTYSYERLALRLPAGAVREEIEKAMAEWTRYVKIEFRSGGKPDRPQNINYLFASGRHGGLYPFDGPGRVLAHTFYPAPPNPEPIAGDIHLDDDEPWSVGGRIDLYSVVLHELGHALGLAHSDDPRDVMYPYYRQAKELSPGDIRAVRRLYASTEPVENPEPLRLHITEPPDGSRTTSAWTQLKGTASGGIEPLQVTWSSETGASGFAYGLPQWSTTAILLRKGMNRITVTVTDAQGASFSRSITLERIEQQPASPPAPDPQPPPSDPPSQPDPGAPPGPAPEPPAQPQPDPPVQPEPDPPAQPGPQPPSQPEPGSPASPEPGDTTVPSLRITYPFTTNVVTSRDSLVFRGTAADNVAVASVKWATNTGHEGTARGTAFWNTGPIPLMRGVNVVTVRAYDAAGNVAWRAVTVTRR